MYFPFLQSLKSISRGSLPGPDGEIDYSKLEALLSPFQIEKFKFLFDFYDTTNDGFIDVSKQHWMKSFSKSAVQTFNFLVIHEICTFVN